ncbi:MAG: sialidase family protein [Candidatus Heimdallarchaeota archaeon]
MRYRKTVFNLMFVTLVSFSLIQVFSYQHAESGEVNAFSTNILLSTEDIIYPQHVEPTLAISTNGTLFAGWKQAYTHDGGGVRVSFTKSSDGGATWSSPFDMPKFQGMNTGQSDPWLVWHNETLFYAYLEYELNQPLETAWSQITVAKSQDYGKTWNPVTATYGEGFADKETMAISSSGVIYVAYDDIVGENVTVRVSRSDDVGMTFSEVGVITDSVTEPVDHLSPYITTDSQGNVYVAWIWYTEANWGDIYVVKSQDQGQTFSVEADINPNDQNASITIADDRVSRASLPALRFHDERLFVSWCARVEEAGGWDVYLRYSDDYGATWSNRIRVNPETEGDQWQPDFDIDTMGRVHYVWLDEQGNSFRPYYRMISISNQGSSPTLGPVVPIASASTLNTFTRPGDYFTVRVDGTDTPHVVWTDGRESEMDVYYSHGIHEETTTNTTPTSFYLFVPFILAMVVGLKRISVRFKS